MAQTQRRTAASPLELLRHHAWSADIARLLASPRISLGRWPTPIESFLDEHAGVVLVKRDDLSGWGRGGAKARKIEHLLGHLLAHGHDELITVAGNVTNLAFDILPALDREGILATLYIQNDPPLHREDRHQIFDGVRDRVILAGSSRAATAARAVRAYHRSRRRGGRPFLLLPGGSHPAAVLGNAGGFLEMAAQRFSRGLALPEAVYVTAATGTTVAGFVIAEHALRGAGCDPVRVVGVQVYPGRVDLWTLGLVRWTERVAGLGERVPRSDITILRTALHGGFGAFPPALAAQCERLADRRGPQVDPIFGGKTWAAMRADLDEVSRADRPILYWHCGFTPEWRTIGAAVRERSPGR